ncbi:MAG: PIN domain-containing protein [Deltaproteobacteria bacterium]|nr:PIN domain-containing protein [Deltaproteobacteria bacterium]
MLAVIDTSVLVAATVHHHIHEQASDRLLQQVYRKKLNAAIATHTIAEYYSTLTSYPGSPHLSPADVLQMLGNNIFPFFEVIDLTHKDYQNALQRVRDLNLRSGAIYDALIYQAALKKKIPTLYTWDLSDFSRLGGK